MMIRLFALLALGALLAACSGLSIPSMSLRGTSGSVTVRTESNPSGAEAKAQTGASCRTPCSLELPSSGLSSVTFSLQGYLPQTVSVNVTTVREGPEMIDTGVSEQIRVEPSQVFVQLELQPPPPPPPPARRRAAPPKPKPQPAPPPPQQGFGPPPSPGFR